MKYSLSENKVTCIPCVGGRGESAEFSEKVHEVNLDKNNYCDCAWIKTRVVVVKANC